MVLDPSTFGSKPTIVIVPGSFSPAYFYSAISKGISAHGYEAVTVDLPSVGRRDPAPSAMDVVIVMHAYGGVPGTESTLGLAKSSRVAAGERGGVTRLIYLTSVVPPVGGSLKTEMGEAVMETICVNGDYMDHQPRNTLASIIFSGMPLSASLKWAEEMPEHSTASFGGEFTYPEYKYIPVSYILCERDLCVKPEYQRKVVEMIRGVGGSVDVWPLDGGHCPNVSVPDEVVQTVMRALGEKV